MPQPRLYDLEEMLYEADTTTQCLLWPGARDDHGYGKIWYDNKFVYVHRKVYELAVGPIPEGFNIDHTCRVKPCYNYIHLDAVPQSENMRRWHMSAEEHKNLPTFI